MSIVTQWMTAGNLANALPNQMTKIVVPRTIPYRKRQELVQADLIPMENQPSNYYFCRYTGKSTAVVAAILFSQQINTAYLFQDEHLHPGIELNRLGDYPLTASNENKQPKDK
jgi:hypothetical protein